MSDETQYDGPLHGNDDGDDEADEDGVPYRETRPALTADRAIAAFFSQDQKSPSAQRTRRLTAAERDLRACLEAEADRVLIDPERELLAAERQFDPAATAAGVADGHVALIVLPTFLDDPRWQGEDLEDRRLRAGLAHEYLRWARRVPELAEAARGCSGWDVDAAVQRARLALRLAS